MSSVSKILEVTDAESVVAKTGAQTESNDLIQALAWQVHPDPELDIAGRLQALPDAEGSWSFGTAHQALVVHAGQPQPVKKGKPFFERCDRFQLIRRRHDPRYQVDRQIAAGYRSAYRTDHDRSFLAAGRVFRR